MSIDFWLWIGFGLVLAIYILIGRVIVSREKWETPRIFHNRSVRLFLVMLPLLGFLAVIAAGFILTSNGWWWLMWSIGCFILFSVRSKL